MTYLTESSKDLGVHLSQIKETDPSVVIGRARTQIFHLFLEVDRRLAQRMGSNLDVAHHLHDVAVDGSGDVVITFDEDIHRKLSKYVEPFSLLVQSVFFIDNALLVTITHKPLTIKIHGPEFVYKRE